MNKILQRSAFFLILLLSIQLKGFSQQGTLPQQNIYYYPDSSKVVDDYQRSQCRLDVYYPKNTRNFATVIWYHGGGITGGKKELPKELLDKGFAVIGVGYRLSPKAKAPAYIEDAAASIAWVFKNIEKYGGDKRLIFVSGHSAGGYLGMMAIMDKSYLNKYDVDANAVAGLIPFSGQCITHFTIRQEQGIKDTQPIIDKYAPLYHVRKDLPPMLLLTGDKEMEMLGRYEENAYLNRMMKLTGNKTTRLFELQGYDHGGMALPGFPLLIKEVNRRKTEILAAK
jgi:acetyl esterase/lipase